MDNNQMIDEIIAMLRECPYCALVDVHYRLTTEFTALRYVEISSAIDERYKRAEAIDNHVKKFTEMLKREEE